MQQLLDFLRAVTGLNSLMNLNNIFPGWAYEAETPYIVMTQISGPADSDKSRVIAKTRAIFQVDVVTETYKAGKDIADLIVAHIDGHVPTTHSFYLEDQRDLPEEDSKKFRRSLDIAVEWQSA